MPNGKKVIYHFGRWHGFNAAFVRLLDEKVTIIILGNKFTRAVYNTARLSYDLFGDYQQGGKPEEEDPESLVTTSPAKKTEASKKQTVKSSDPKAETKK